MLNYKYYDTPEGQDVYKKVFVTSKYATIAGLGAASFDVLLFSHPKGIVRTVGRFAWYLGPLVGMASAFTVTANVAQNYRGKNDAINYFLGGLAAGSIFGAWSKNVVAAVPISLLLGAVAMIKKTAIDEGWQLLPDTQLANKSIQSHRHDWTWVKDIPELKTWTTGKD